jgi:hypothetical protein
MTLANTWRERVARDSLMLAVPPEFSPRDYVIFLLHIVAEIEHSLMVQYLYAAYSLGGSGVPAHYQARVGEWREVILGIAKEEMGHLISVQNVLRLLGGSIHFERQEYPWRIEFYPFPFKLERFTIESLARYVYAESPEVKDWSADELPLREEIVRLATKGEGEVQLHRAGELFALLIGRLRDPEFLGDEEFDASTHGYQASWDEWGRGYRESQRGNAAGSGSRAAPDVLITPFASRAAAVAGLAAIAAQGEAPSAERGASRSHFRRLFEVYRQFRAILRGDPAFSPSRPVPDNPRTPRDLNPGMEHPLPTEWRDDDARGACIIDPRARDWAHLFNIRYRMLLAYLAHAYSLSGALIRAGQLTMRGAIVNFTFGEMYSLQTVAGILVDLPLGDGQHNAAPPFEMPYSLAQPADTRDHYRLHRDLLAASFIVEERLRKHGVPADVPCLTALRKADEHALAMIDRAMRDGHRLPEQAGSAIRKP